MPGSSSPPGWGAGAGRQSGTTEAQPSGLRARSCSVQGELVQHVAARGGEHYVQAGARPTTGSWQAVATL
ncbi:hypothetical protein [Streptomyces sp. NPDC048411]|uniref:hypothetical protein n=1 Tax=Streptomyces sp. NPDC048411 TaxID=3157206 RepID=UPI003455516E